MHRWYNWRYTPHNNPPSALTQTTPARSFPPGSAKSAPGFISCLNQLLLLRSSFTLLGTWPAYGPPRYPPHGNKAQTQRTLANPIFRAKFKDSQILPEFLANPTIIYPWSPTDYRIPRGYCLANRLIPPPRNGGLVLFNVASQPSFEKDGTEVQLSCRARSSGRQLHFAPALRSLNSHLRRHRPLPPRPKAQSAILSR